MNTKKFVLTFLVIFVLLEATNFLIHGVILSSTYKSDDLKMLFRPEAEMMAMMWMMYVFDLVWAFFFVFFFVKGYEGKGVAEGIRFGIYIGLFWNLVNVHGSYVIYPMPYSLAMQWFIFGFIQVVILGAVASLIYKPKTAEAAQPAVV